MGMWLRAMTWRQKFFLLITTICMISMYAGLADYDWYWQVELGKSVVKDFNFNGIYDLYWGTLGVGEYLDHEWLSNVLFYFCSLVGEFGVSVTKFVICAAYAAGTFWYLDSLNKPYNDAALLGICTHLFIISTIFIKAKAYIISVVFLFGELVLLRKYKEKQENKYFLYMLGVLVLWNNMHSGSVPLFFIVAGVYWLTELNFDKKVLATLPVYIAGLCINPYGYKLFLFDFQHNFDPVMKQIVLDWRPIDAKEVLGVICAILIFEVVFFTLGVDIKAHKFDLIMLCITTLLGFQSARHLIYVAPFYYSILLDNKYDLKLGYTARFMCTGFCAGIAVLSLLQAFSSGEINKQYGMQYMEPELAELLVETNTDNNDGLFNDSNIELWSLGLKHFTNGAFPCVRERMLDEYEMLASASDARITELIEKYGLTKFVAVKYNAVIQYGDGPGILYEYLSAHDEYELLYDSDFYYYFVRKDVLV